MRKIVSGFIRRGLVAWGFGPIVLAVFYLILRHRGLLEALTVEEVCTGIFSLAALAFIAGGMNVVYQMERLPLMVAILIHGSVLYASYLLTYLVNGWLEEGTIPLLVFTAIFAVGYLTIWVIIYAVIRRRTAKLNNMLNKKRQISNP